MANSLVDDNFIQYKCKEYTTGEYYKEFAPGLGMGTTVYMIKAVNPLVYEPFSLSIEPTIQRLSNEKLPEYRDNEAWCDLSLQLTKDYGFLYLPKHIEGLNADSEVNQNFTKLFTGTFEEYKSDNPYDGEEASDWKRLISTVHYCLKRISDESFINSIHPQSNIEFGWAIEKYLNGVNPVFDFETNTISLKCESLASAIILKILSNKKHLKSCEVCSKLFFSTRSNTQYCNTTCGRRNQGDRKQKGK